MLNVGGRAATIPLSAGARDIEIECWAVGGNQIFKKSYPTVGMYAFTVGGTVQLTNMVEGSLKADFGDKLTAFGNQVNTAFRGEKTAPGQRAIRFNHEAGYVAEMLVLYIVNENLAGTTVPVPKNQSTPKLTAGIARTLVIPNELAPNTKIQSLSGAMEHLKTRFSLPLCRPISRARFVLKRMVRLTRQRAARVISVKFVREPHPPAR